MPPFQKAKSRASTEALEAIRIVEDWYKDLDYFIVKPLEKEKLNAQMHKLIKVIEHLDEDRRQDRLHFVKMFKKLFSRKNKELTKECEKAKAELFKEKVHVQQLEKQIEEMKK